MGNICRSLKKKNLSSPQVTYPYRIYWCKKMGRKSHIWAPLTYGDNLLRVVLKRLKRHNSLKSSCGAHGNFPRHTSIPMFKGFSCTEWYFTAVVIMLLVRIWRIIKLSGIPSIQCFNLSAKSIVFDQKQRSIRWENT